MSEHEAQTGAEIPTQPQPGEPDGTDDAEDDAAEEGEEPEDSRSQGERIAALVEEEAARVEAEEAQPLTVRNAPPPDPYTRTCPTCEGYGQTLTGSIVDGQEFRDCVDCRARGWQERLERSADDPPAEDHVGPREDSWNWG